MVRGNIPVIILLFALATPFTLACLTPVGDDTLINESTVICTGTYYINDTDLDGLFDILSGVVLDCNSSSFIGDNTGFGLYLMNDDTGVENCIFANYSTGIRINADRGTLRNIRTTNNSQYGLNLDVSLFSELQNIIADYNQGDGILASSMFDSSTFENITAHDNGNIGLQMNGDYNNITSIQTYNNGNYGTYIQGDRNRFNNLTSNYNTEMGIQFNNNGNNNVLQNITANHNHDYGIYILNSRYNVLSEVKMQNNTYGAILLLAASNSIVHATIVNNTYGISAHLSSSNNQLTDITASNNIYGIVASSSITLTNSTITNNTLIGFNSTSSNIIVYNNRFNNTNNAWSNASIAFNTTLQAGVNMLGGSRLGGNFWATPAGDGCSQTNVTDMDGDLVGNVGTCAIPGGNNTDYRPLTYAQSINATIAGVQSNSYVRQNVTINVTPTRSSNITIELNRSGIFELFASANNQASAYSTTWYTNNGSYTDGNYSLRITITAADNAALTTALNVTNLTVDNTAPNVTWIWPSMVPAQVSFNSTGVTLTNIFGSLWAFQLASVLINFSEETNIYGTCQVGYKLYYPLSGTSGGASSENIIENELFNVFVVQALSIATPTETERIFLFDYDCADAAGNRVANDVRWVYLDNRSPVISVSFPQSVQTSYAGLNLSIQEWNPENDLLNYTLRGPSNQTGLIQVSQFTPRNSRTISTGPYSSLEENKTYSYNYSYTNSRQFPDLLNGEYVLALSAHDVLGNNATTNITFTVNDTTPPTWSQAITQITSYSATLIISGTENASYDLDIDGVHRALEGVNLTASIIDLVPGTAHSVVVTSCDLNENCNTTASTFTTDPAQQSSGGGSGGAPSEALISSELSVQALPFKLSTGAGRQFRWRGEQHRIDILRIDGHEVTLQISSTPIVLTLTEGENRTVDLNGDGRQDVRVIAQSITAAGASIALQELSGTETAQTQPTTTTPAPLTATNTTEEPIQEAATTDVSAQAPPSPLPPLADGLPKREPAPSSAWPIIALTAAAIIIALLAATRFSKNKGKKK